MPNNSGHVRVFNGTVLTGINSSDINGEADSDRSGYSISYLVMVQY